MGFLKRLFSVGTKKNKKQRAEALQNVPLPDQSFAALRPVDEEEHEAALGRLLRSTSARYVESGLDYANMPPLPHPINKVIQTPASSTVSLASTSISQRGTYNVTVHKRKRHASTEFPLANRDQDRPTSAHRDGGNLTAVEDSRVLRLRSDPSVTSLLELYDEHGKLSNDAFSNSPPSSPPKEGRAQCRRSGSTLRQLLGAPAMGANDNSEGDISWAERFLAESEATSSNSSIKTPTTPEYQEEYGVPEISFVTDGDLSLGTFDNPAISSMEVEINNSQDVSQELEDPYKKSSPYIHSDPSTPQRASQIFGFLTNKKQINLDRTLPQLPSCFSSPSDENGDDKSEAHIPDDSLDFSSFEPARFSAIPKPLVDNTPRNMRPRSSIIENTPVPRNRISEVPRSAFSDDSHDCHDVTQTAMRMHQLQEEQVMTPPPNVQEVKQNDIRVLMSGPTKVIVTAATPSTNPLHNGPSRLPRGPRGPHHRKTSSSSSRRRRSVLGEVSSNAAPTTTTSAGDPFVIVTSKQKMSSHKRSNSATSIVSLSRRSHDEHSDYVSHPKKMVAAVSPTVGQYKENQLGLSVQSELPATPLRTNSGTASRSLFRTVVQQGMFHHPGGAPSPNANSSSEMSPLGRQIMTDVRKQRMRARDSERAKGTNRF